MILAATSALHGYDAVSKGYLIAISAALYAGIYALVSPWLAVIPLVLVPLWWFGLRGGKQAQLELQYMDTWNPPHPSIWDVLKAHYYTGWLTLIALKCYNYTNAPNLINTGKFWDVRRPTEIATGLTGDIMLGLALWITTVY